MARDRAMTYEELRDGPTTRAVRALIEDLRVTMPLASKLMDDRLQDILAHVIELEAQADRLEAALVEEMQASDPPLPPGPPPTDLGISETGKYVDFDAEWKW